MIHLTSLRIPFIVAVLWVSIGTNLHAESPREQLNALVTQLQGNPGDQALREQIIKLAQRIDPSPAVPEEAERRLGRGQAAFEIAKVPADFDKAIAEFQAASNAAPWLAAPYYNLGIAQEKTHKYQEAMASFQMYLLAAPAAADASEVKQRIFKIEYLAEQPPAPPSEDELLARLNGARFIRTDLRVGVLDSHGDAIWELNGRELATIEIVRQLGPEDQQWNPQILNTPVRRPQTNLAYKGHLRWEAPRADTCPPPFDTWPDCFTYVEIAADGSSLTFRGFSFSTHEPYTQVYPRQN